MGDYLVGRVGKENTIWNKHPDWDIPSIIDASAVYGENSDLEGSSKDNLERSHWLFVQRSLTLRNRSDCFNNPWIKVFNGKANN